jgi:ABC-type phosphate transport system auxiliary subunit
VPPNQKPVLVTFFSLGSYSSWNAPWVMGEAIVSLSVVAIIGLIVFLHKKERGMWDEEGGNFL